MARTRKIFSPNRSRRPWWLPLLLIAAAWIYNQFFRAPSKPTRSTSTNRRETPARDSKQRGKERPADRAESQEGGNVFDDVVIRVTDGDTVKLRRQGTVRLIGVDCPEKAQPGGVEATEFATRVLLDKNVQVELCAKQPTDRYGRGLAFVYFTGNNGQRILFNSELVRQGYARVYSLRPCTVDENQWNAYYEEARSAHRGLFQRMNEVPDAAAYRRRKRSRVETS